MCIFEENKENVGLGNIMMPGGLDYLETHNFEREKHHYLELDTPLDPNNPNGLKVSNKFKKLIHTDAE